MELLIIHEDVYYRLVSTPNGDSKCKLKGCEFFVDFSKGRDIGCPMQIVCNQECKDRGHRVTMEKVSKE